MCLINARALKDAMYSIATMTNNESIFIDVIIDEIDNAQPVDAVEVVRCGKCLYYSETTGKDSGKPCGYGVCTKPFHITNIVANEDFCSFGQRRADAMMDGDGNA